MIDHSVRISSMSSFRLPPRALKDIGLVNWALSLNVQHIEWFYIFILVIAPKPVQYRLSPASAIACYLRPALHLDLACHQNHMIAIGSATVGPRPLDSALCRGSRKRAPSANVYWCRNEPLCFPRWCCLGVVIIKSLFALKWMAFLASAALCWMIKSDSLLLFNN